MSVTLTEFVPQHNQEVLAAVSRIASPAYQARIPEAVRGDISGTVNALMRFTPQRNEFINALINQVGEVVVRNQIWSNPLSIWKGGWLPFGDSIEEVQLGLAEGNTYDVDREALEKAIFGVERLEVQSAFHKINREEFYKLTIKPAMIQRAFQSEYGLSDFLTKQMTVLSTSDNWDEFLIMANLLKEYYDSKGFFKVQIGDLSSFTATAADSRTAIKSMRAMAQTLPFMSRNYNAARMPMSVRPEDLMLVATPNFMANIDVEALAGAFNIQSAALPARTVVIPPEFWPIPGAQAIMASKDLIVQRDSRIEMTSADNPAALHTNHFLHHQGVYSTSPFAPAVLFTTEVADSITLFNPPVVDITPIVLKDKDKAIVTTLSRGFFYAASAVAETLPVGGKNTAVRWELWGGTSVRTYISNTGMLFVGPDESATTLKLVAVATGDRDNREELDIPIAATPAAVTLWPSEVNNPNDSLTVTPNAPTRATNTITIVATTNVTYKNAQTGAVLATGPQTALTTGQVLNVEAVPADGYSIANGVTSAWSYTGV